MSFADEYVARLRPWLTPDMETYLRAIASMFGEVELLAFDTDEHEGWTILFDPDRCPAKYLPYLAQYVGERLPVGISEPAAREWIKDAPNQRRGTIESIIRVAQRNLTGQRMVSIRERDGAGEAEDEDRITVITYTPETPDPALVERDLRRDAIAADIVLNYEVLDGQTWNDVKATHATWADVLANNATWADVATAKVGATTWVRPRPW